VLCFCDKFHTQRSDYRINIDAGWKSEQKTFVRRNSRKSNLSTKPAQFSIVITHLAQNATDAICVCFWVCFDLVGLWIVAWSAVKMRFVAAS